MAVTVPYQEMSAKPLFIKCCFCIPLRIGCFILGYLNLIFNTLHTLCLLALTTYIGVSTHGFDHFDAGHPATANQTLDVDSTEKPLLNKLGLLLMVILSANIAWLMINVACLVGLHKKRPGPIKVYVSFATARLLLSMAGFAYLVFTTAAHANVIASQILDLGLTAYFILVYYVHAKQLERHEEVPEAPQHPALGGNAYIYPPKTDKEILVA